MVSRNQPTTHLPTHTDRHTDPPTQPTETHPTTPPHLTNKNRPADPAVKGPHPLPFHILHVKTNYYSKVVVH